MFFYHGVWFNTHSICCGATTKNSLRLFDYDKHFINEDCLDGNIKSTVHKYNTVSLSNGHLMRCSAFHVWFYYLFKWKIIEVLKTDDTTQFLKLYNLIYKELRKDVEIAHPNRENVVADSVYAFMVQGAMCGYSSDLILKKLGVLLKNEIFERDGTPESAVKTFVKNSLEDFRTIKDDFEYLRQSFQGMGYYKQGFKMALYFLYNFPSIKPTSSFDKLRMIMNQICNYGGDTDTNAAIVGQVLGPLIGAKNFNKNDVKLVLEYVQPQRFEYSAAFIYYFVEYLDGLIYNIEDEGEKDGGKIDGKDMRDKGDEIEVGGDNNSINAQTINNDNGVGVESEDSEHKSKQNITKDINDIIKDTKNLSGNDGTKCTDLKEEDKITKEESTEEQEASGENSIKLRNTAGDMSEKEVKKLSLDDILNILKEGESASGENIIGEKCDKSNVKFNVIRFILQCLYTDIDFKETKVKIKKKDDNCSII